jgi:hypothetical protein
MSWEPDGIAGIIASIGMTGWIPVMVWWKHRIRLEEIRTQRNAGLNEETVQALREVQRELRDLRDTSTKFDLSFDAGISRLEERVMRLEQRATSQEPVAYSRNGATPAPGEPPTVLTVGQGQR